MLIAASGKFRLECLIGLAVIQAGDALVARFQLHQHLGQFSIGSRSGDQRHIRCPFEDLFAFLLRHATEHAKALPLFVQGLVIVQAIEHLLLRLIADGAGVVQNQRRIDFGLDLAVTFLHQSPNDFFRVMGIHLAAESFNVKRLVEQGHRT